MFLLSQGRESLLFETKRHLPLPFLIHATLGISHAALENELHRTYNIPSQLPAERAINPDRLALLPRVVHRIIEKLHHTYTYVVYLVLPLSRATYKVCMYRGDKPGHTINAGNPPGNGNEGTVHHATTPGYERYLT